MENNIDRAAKMLEEASKLLKSDASGSQPSQSQSNQSKIQETLNRASNMLQQSSSSGLFRRLNRSERLRASNPYQQQSTSRRSSRPVKVKVKKPVEFALLKCFEEDEEEPFHLKWDSVVAEGILMLGEDDDEDAIRSAVINSLANKFPLLGKNDFEFTKVRYKQIKSLELSPGTEYNFPVVKKLAGQGLLYLKAKQGFEFVYEEKSDRRSDEKCILIYDDKDKVTDDENDECFSKPTFGEDKKSETTENSQTKKEVEQETVQKAEQESSQSRVNIDSAHVPLIDTLEPQCPNLSGNDVNLLVKKIYDQSLHDPVEILRYLQKEMVKGRALEITNTSETFEGETNHICVDRHNLISSTFAELESIEDFNITFEVDFIGEIAQDHGGPRKEWIRLMNAAIKEKYFSNGLKEFLSEDYYYVGVMVGIALLQNGQLPSYIPLDITNTLLEINSPNECVSNLKRGLDIFGLRQIFQRLPTLLHLLRPSNTTMTARMLIHLLKPQFSEEGSSAFLKEKEMYSLLIKYIRQVASGRREPITLGSMLAFVTGAEEEPILGFAIPPSITFKTCDETVKQQVILFGFHSLMLFLTFPKPQKSL